MKSSILDLIRSAFVRKDEKFRKKLSVFLICLLISVIIWFTLKLSDEYDVIIEVPVTFTNIPRNKVLTQVSETMLQVEVLEKGSDIFRRLHVEPANAVSVSLKYLPVYPKGDGIYQGILNTSMIITDIERSQNLLGKVISVSPDSIYLTFETERSVKVPVKADFDITFKKEYKKYGQAEFTPDCVMVKGPEKIIRLLDSANLGTIKLEQLDDNYSGEKSFEKDSLNRSLSYFPDIVSYTIPVEKFTEAEVEVPVRIINNDGMQAKTFPDKVTVFYTVALKDYPKMEPGMIQAVADFSSVNIAEDDKISVTLQNHPQFIRISKIRPEKVEFIIIN